MVRHLLQDELGGPIRGLVHDEVAHTGKHFHLELGIDELARAVSRLRSNGAICVAPDVERRHSRLAHLRPRRVAAIPRQGCFQCLRIANHAKLAFGLDLRDQVR